MSTLEVWLLAFSLAMDCFTVSIASGIIMRRVHWRTILIMSFFFGLFQALMPLGGWFCASRFHHLIESFDHWIALQYPLPVVSSCAVFIGVLSSS